MIFLSFLYCSVSLIWKMVEAVRRRLLDGVGLLGLNWRS